MPVSKRVPVEVVEKARSTVASLTRHYAVAAPPAPVEAPKKKPAREKVVAALRRLHPMD